jgi:membrane dipeptidase
MWAVTPRRALVYAPCTHVPRFLPRSWSWMLDRALAAVLVASSAVSACRGREHSSATGAGATSASPSSARTSTLGQNDGPSTLASGSPPLSIGELHRSAFVVDAHADTPMRFLEKAFDVGARNAEGQVDFPRLKEGGVDAEFFIAYVPAKYAERGAAAYAHRAIALIHRMIDEHPDLATLATSTAEMRSVEATGKRAILIGVEGGHAIEDSLDELRKLYAEGARYMTLTHTNTNHWADSSGDVAEHHGLTLFGEDVVREMNRLGMMVDVSHVSDETFYDVLRVTNAPIIASHSSARALCPNKRNLDDDMLRAVGKNHGVVMVNFLNVFLSTAKKGQPVPLSVLIDHLEHVAKVAGIDSVGLGSDFDNSSAYPTGMEDVSKIPAITEALRARGFSDADVRKVLGENLLRVFAAVEAAAVN